MIPSTSEIVYNAPVNEAVVALAPNTTKYVLDIGCGAGTHARALSELGLIVDGITLSEAAKCLAAKWCRQVYLHKCEAESPDLTAKCDCVICSRVLEP